MKIQILNGPNLNLIGQREKQIYGDIRLEDYLKLLREHFADITLYDHQTNLEGELVDRIQRAGKEVNGVVLNAGGYTHTSVSIRDAIASIGIPVVEVHVSNIYQRESFRHESYIAPVCEGSIIGFGLDGYRLAIEGLRLIHLQQSKK